MSPVHLLVISNTVLSLALVTSNRAMAFAGLVVAGLALLGAALRERLGRSLA